MRNEGGDQATNGERPRTSRPAVVSFAAAALAVTAAVVLCAAELVPDVPTLRALDLELLAVAARVVAPIAVILGVIAIVRIARAPKTRRGMWLAIPGVLLGVFSIVILLQSSSRPPDGLAAACASNIRRLGTAMDAYAWDYDLYPPAQTWSEALSEHAESERTLRCPAADDQEAPSYAMNRKLAGVSRGDVETPGRTVLLFECAPGKNQARGPELFPSPPRHRKGHWVVFVDGRAEQIRASGVGKLDWDP